MKPFEIDKRLDFITISSLLKPGTQLELSKAAEQRIVKCRDYLDKRIRNGNDIIYGVNTGFGSLCNTIIAPEDLAQLQVNLLMSHACGMGDEVPQDIVKLMLLLKIQSLAYGHSGVQLDTVQRLVDFFNHDIIPVVYELGSLGASGDLAPLSHLCLPLVGMGEVYYKGVKQNAADVLKELKLKPVQLQSKEGLALINGTQFMSAYGTYLILMTYRLLDQMDTIAAMSFDAFDCRLDPFDADIQKIRPHEGQRATGVIFRLLLHKSEIAHRKKTHVQDPYSFRCIPQVHGASKGVLDHVKEVILTEINSVTDNPNVFPDLDKVVSGGNFHGQILALALDYLCLAIHELGSISERRIYLLISGQRGLPPFLAKNAGLNSGFMIMQYTAASIVSQNKQLCTPASIDSIISSNGQEDHVSMGANAATKALKVAKNVKRIAAIELMTAAQALDFRRPANSSSTIEKFHESFRNHVPFIENDVMMYELIKDSETFLETMLP